MSTRTVVVAMLTYRRPEDLAVALPAFRAEAATHPGTRVLVVDNDPDASARAAVTALDDDAVRYVHEPEPGIAVARNRALDESADADVLVFVDDDEVPTPGWLGHLLRTFDGADGGGAAAGAGAAPGAGAVAGVVGPVVSELAAEPDRWVAAGRFFDRRRLPTGSPVTVAATNNLLLDLHVVRRLGLRFDAVFGLSGGSDTLFTRALVRAGGRLVWCDEAVVVDRVPVTRLTREWVLRRARRSGNSAGRVAVVLAQGVGERTRVRAGYLVRGAVRVAGGTARRTVGLVTRSAEHDARGARSVQRGLGMMTGVLGHVVYEYRRD